MTVPHSEVHLVNLRGSPSFGGSLQAVRRGGQPVAHIGQRKFFPLDQEGGQGKERDRQSVWIGEIVVKAEGRGRSRRNRAFHHKAHFVHNKLGT